MTADLLIVGGGFTGLWSAAPAKEQMPHLNVVLIEAGKVAHGTSGGAGGIISTSVMHGLPNAVRRRCRPIRSTAIWSKPIVRTQT